MISEWHVATVILNYNSAVDIATLLPQMQRQDGIRHTIIIIDNASNSEDVKNLKSVFSENFRDGYISTTKRLSGLKKVDLVYDNYLILNDQNRGYSAGNNIGIDLAKSLSADAVLIANPDMRIDNKYYVSSLARTLFSDKKISISASRIVDLDKKDLNPLREPSFIEEFGWPVIALMRRLGLRKDYQVSFKGEKSEAVSKVSGCCLMIKTEFLVKNRNLDERVFLYSEEAILSAQVSRLGTEIRFDPKECAVHAHESDKKSAPYIRIKNFCESRIYYLEEYSGYSRWQIKALKVSYQLMKSLHLIRHFINNKLDK